MDRDTIIRDALRARKTELERKLVSRSGENASLIRDNIDVLTEEIEVKEAAIAQLAKKAPEAAEEVPEGEK